MYCVAIVKNELKREVFVADMAQQTPSTLSMRSNEREAAFLTTFGYINLAKKVTISKGKSWLSITFYSR